MDQIRQRLEKFKQKQKGFTLVELIVVIAIIGILAGVMLPRYFGFTDQARESAAKSDANSIRTISETYYASYGVWPKVTVTGSAVKGTSGSSATSVLKPDTTAAVNSSLSSPTFQGELEDSTGTSLTAIGADGVFTYVSNTGISFSCDASGNITLD